MKTIIEMAREAELCDDEGRDDNSIIIKDHLERFAELVRADERDRAMRENAYVLAEREACAKVAEDMNRAVLAMLNVTSQPKALAAAIRARGNT